MNYDVGKATRAPEIHDRVPSQETERHQAVDPTYWGEANPPVRWRWLAPVAFVAYVAALVALAPFAAKWAGWQKFLVGVPVVIVSIWVIVRMPRVQR